MERKELINNDKGFYHIVTVIICLGIVLTASLALLISYIVRLNSDKTRLNEYKQESQYNRAYFSDRIFKGITVSGIDVGEMTVEEAKKAITEKLVKEGNILNVAFFIFG